MDRLEIVYQDEHFVAINKPANLLVHRTWLSQDKTFALQRLRDQLRRRVFIVHRLDRATSGVLVFAFSSDAARELCQCFEHRRVEKEYLAVVRGFADAQGCIDKPLAEEKHRQPRPAVTRYQRIATTELPVAVGRYATARYSLVRVMPETGRMHQIRRHFGGIAHPVIGDVNHGDRHHNHFFRDHFSLQRLLLMATRLRFVHPYNGRPVAIEASVPDEVGALFARFGWTAPLSPQAPAVRAPQTLP